MVELTVIWTKTASSQLSQSLKYLKKKSIVSADKIKDEIIATASNLSNHPEIHPLDRFKTNNDGSIRAFEKYSYRVSYKVSQSQIVILRVRHTSREPLNH